MEKRFRDHRGEVLGLVARHAQRHILSKFRGGADDAVKTTFWQAFPDFFAPKMESHFSSSMVRTSVAFAVFASAIAVLMQGVNPSY